MFFGRKEELQQLEEIYLTKHSNLIILYGRDGIGKTSLVRKFCENKAYYYYQAIECTDNEQLRRISEVFNCKYTDYIEKGCSDLILCKADNDKKQIIIIDEFQLMKCMLTEAVVKVFTNEEMHGSLMIILISSSINWVENVMVSEMKNAARFFTGFIKLKELSFTDTVNWFSKSSVEDCIMIRAIFGGVPGYLKYWQENRRVRENIISLLFSKESVLYNEAERILKTELRELSAYNTILLSLASSRTKLNDIYSYTGFSRAKISVYLKNLIQMDIVEKVNSYNTKKVENTQKGIYRIKDNFINYYYAYVFCHKTQIEEGKGRNIYDTDVKSETDSYMRQYFTDVCREFLEIMSRYGKLTNRYSEWRSWHGKTGIIDIIGVDEKKNLLAAVSSYREEAVTENEVDDFVELCNYAGIEPSVYYMFSKGGFSDDAVQKAKEKNIKFIAMKDL